MADDNGDEISLYSVAANGTIATAPSSPLSTGAAGSGPSSASFSPTGLLASADQNTGAVSVVAPAPTATITTPNNQTLQLSSAAPAAFSCADPCGVGIASCVDSNGSTSPGSVSTSNAGTFTYTVTATNTADQTATASISYTVSRAPTALRATAVLSPSGISATLTRTGAVLPGQQLTFKVGPIVVCTATTGPTGKADCTSLAARLAALLAGGYTVSFAGSSNYVASTAKAS